MVLDVRQHRQVPDPSMSDAEYLHQRSIAPHKPDIGKVWVQENPVTRIGALVFIRQRSKHHERAAEAFKNDYEALYGSGSPGIDPSRQQVDTSTIGDDKGMVARLDRGKRLGDARELLGKDGFDALVACIVLGIPAGEGEHWRQRKDNVAAVLEALTRLAVAWGFQTRP